MRISRHAHKRIDERCGLSGTAAEKMAVKAKEFGLSQKDTTGAFNKYLGSLFLSHMKATNIRVYNRYVFMFDPKYVLITVTHLPKVFHKVEDKLKKKKAISSSSNNQLNSKEEMTKKVNFIPQGTRVLVEPAPAEAKTSGGIIIPDSVKEKPHHGVVAAVGVGKKDDPMTFKEGEKVLYGKFSGSEVTIDGKDYLIMRQEDILGSFES